MPPQTTPGTESLRCPFPAYWWFTCNGYPRLQSVCCAVLFIAAKRHIVDLIGKTSMMFASHVLHEYFTRPLMVITFRTQEEKVIAKTCNVAYLCFRIYWKELLWNQSVICMFRWNVNKCIAAIILTKSSPLPWILSLQYDVCISLYVKRTLHSCVFWACYISMNRFECCFRACRIISIGGRVVPVVKVLLIALTTFAWRWSVSAACAAYRFAWLSNGAVNAPACRQISPSLLAPLWVT